MKYIAVSMKRKMPGKALSHLKGTCHIEHAVQSAAGCYRADGDEQINIQCCEKRCSITCNFTSPV